MFVLCEDGTGRQEKTVVHVASGSEKHIFEMATETPTNHINVTSAMIDAGVLAFYGADLRVESPEDAVLCIFAAMMRAKELEQKDLSGHVKAIMSLTKGPLLDVGSEPDRPVLTDTLARGDTLDRLARRLHETLERLDPTDGPSWGFMPDINKELYRQCVKAVVREFLSAVSEFPR